MQQIVAATIHLESHQEKGTQIEMDQAKLLLLLTDQGTMKAVPVSSKT